MLARGAVGCWRSFTLSITTLSRRCSTAPLFSDVYNFSPLVLDKLHEEGLHHPTDVQQKSLTTLYDKKPVYTVINAETGSGKTLCFLLPILELFARYKERGLVIPPAFALVLVPTSLLAHQINDVFRSLAQPEWGSGLSIKGTKLSIKRDTNLIIATPTTLYNFSVTKLIQNVRYLCIDEADLLLTGGEKAATWHVLNSARRVYQQKVAEIMKAREDTENDGNDRTEEHISPILDQKVFFTAATFPAGGPMTVTYRLKRWLPHRTEFITTECTHNILPSVDLRFVNIEGDTILTEAGLESNAVVDESQKRDQSLKNDNELRLKRLISDLDELKNEQQDSLPKILVFANTQQSADEVYQYLSKRSKNDRSHWWSGKVLLAVAHVDTLTEVMEKFKSGDVRVLVCTDLLSRGVDMPAVTAVIQFDFPGNSADFLHRAGRTARAGSKGIVISYVGKGDQDLAAQVKAVTEDKSKSFDSIFSRNKMLRRKINRIKAAELKAAEHLEHTDELRT